ncbi:MAG: GAF domain-containing protein [Sphingomicrobium sp.]
MPFAAALRDSLLDRDSEIAGEFERGDSLEDVLSRHLRTVERMSGDDVFTCILLLSADGKQLSIGAAPSIPESYCRVGDSVDIGLNHGSCAAAAYLGHAVYSVDIESDPIWADFGPVALRHGYRSCWSTPIRDPSGAMIGTFAILHRTKGMPTPEEIQAIELITGSVAEAIIRSRGWHSFNRPDPPRPVTPKLRLVSNDQEAHDPAVRLLTIIEKLQSMAANLEHSAACARSDADARVLKSTAELSRKLSAKIMLQIQLVSSGRPR